MGGRGNSHTPDNKKTKNFVFNLSDLPLHIIYKKDSRTLSPGVSTTSIIL